jgi:hypothetical protein
VGEKRKLYKVLVGKRPLLRQRHRWEDGLRMDLGEIGWGVVGWIHMAQVMDWWQNLVHTVMNLWVLSPWS